MPIGSTSPLDYDLAAATARRLAAPPPQVGWAEAADVVTELRGLAVRAEEHVRAVTGLVPPGEVLGATVVDRGGWAAANVEGFRLVLDPIGQPQTSTLLDYLLPTAADLPDIRIEHIETPAPTTTLGTKGVGEAGTAGAPAAIHCAVNDALAGVGARVSAQPIRPEDVLTALASAG